MTVQKSAGGAASNPLGMFIPASGAGTAIVVNARVAMVACRLRRTVRLRTPSRYSSHTSRVASTCRDISESCPPAARTRHRCVWSRPSTAARRRSAATESTLSRTPSAPFSRTPSAPSRGRRPHPSRGCRPHPSRRPAWRPLDRRRRLRGRAGGGECRPARPTAWRPRWRGAPPASLSSSVMARRSGRRRWKPASAMPGPHPGVLSSSVMVSRQ